MTDKKNNSATRPPAQPRQPTFGTVAWVGPLSILFVATVYALFWPLPPWPRYSYCGDDCVWLGRAAQGFVLGGMATVLVAAVGRVIARARGEQQVRFGCLVIVMGALAILLGLVLGLGYLLHAF